MDERPPAPSEKVRAREGGGQSWGGGTMVDMHTRIREQPREVLEIIARSMDLRASASAMQAICSRYMGQIALPEGGRVLEVGCGNGAATKLIMQYIDPAQLVGVDPSPVFIDMAREAFAGEPRASFLVGDAAATGQAEACFDLVIAHTVYSHLPDPEGALVENSPGSQAWWATRHFRWRLRHHYCCPVRWRSVAGGRWPGVA